MTLVSLLPLFKIAQVELTYRNKVKASERPIVQKSDDAYKLLINNWDMNKIELVESFKILLLDRRSACLGISEISSGGVSGCMADPKIIFATALKARASNLILAHNHPSGQLVPSNSDISISRKLREGGKVLDINVLDHLIVSPDQYYSFADEGKLIP